MARRTCRAIQHAIFFMTPATSTPMDFDCRSHAFTTPPTIILRHRSCRAFRLDAGFEPALHTHAVPPYISFKYFVATPSLRDIDSREFATKCSRRGRARQRHRLHAATLRARCCRPMISLLRPYRDADTRLPRLMRAAMPSSLMAGRRRHGQAARSRRSPGCHEPSPPIRRRRAAADDRRAREQVELMRRAHVARRDGPLRGLLGAHHHHQFLVAAARAAFTGRHRAARPFSAPAERSFPRPAFQRFIEASVFTVGAEPPISQLKVGRARHRFRRCQLRLLRASWPEPRGLYADSLMSSPAFDAQLDSDFAEASRRAASILRRAESSAAIAERLQIYAIGRPVCLRAARRRRF